MIQDYYSDFIPEHYFHVFNRAVGTDKLFLQNENYQFFLSRVKDHILPVADLFCYNLLPNHFHFFIRIKTEDELRIAYSLKHINKTNKLGLEQMPNFVLQQWSNLFNSYAKSFNKIFGRKGRLFMESVKRSEIKNPDYFNAIVYYIHTNVIHHGLCNKIKDWQYSSYYKIISDSETFLKRDELLDWFGGIKGFSKFHKQPPGFSGTPEV